MDDQRPFPSHQMQAALLAGIELGLGGFLHALHVPLTGTILSLNQAFLLSHMSSCGPTSWWAPTQVSGIAASIRSLAPMGKKMTSVLAIAMQGLLFNLGTLLFRNHLVGRLLGGVLLSLWGWVQPILFYSFLFGSTGLQAVSFGVEKFLGGYQGVMWVVFGLVFFKAIVALGAVLLGEWISAKSFRTYHEKMYQWSLKRMALLQEDHEEVPLSQRVLAALRDLLCPLFLLGWMGSLAFLFMIEAETSLWLRVGVQSLAMGWLAFFISRSLPRRFRKKMKEWLCPVTSCEPIFTPSRAVEE